MPTTSKQQGRCPTCGSDDLLYDGYGDCLVLRNPSLPKPLCSDDFHTPAQPVEQGEGTTPSNQCVRCGRFADGHDAMRCTENLRASLTTANQQIEELRGVLSNVLAELEDCAERLDEDGLREMARAGRFALADAPPARAEHAAEAKIEELTRERDDDYLAQCNLRLQRRAAAAEAERDTLREAVGAAFSATYNPDISHLTSTRTVRNILQSVLITPPAKGDE